MHDPRYFRKTNQKFIYINRPTYSNMSIKKKKRVPSPIKKKKAVKIKIFLKAKKKRVLKHRKTMHTKTKERQKKEKMVLRGNETSIDLLYRRIQEKGKMSLNEVMTFFHVSKEVAEEWGEILEKHGLITIEYPLFGNPLFKKIKEEKKETEHGE